MSKNVLARLLEHPGIWRGRSFTRVDTLASGFPELDVRLGGGWPKVGLVEMLATHPGSGELRLLLPLLARLTQQHQSRWCTWIAPPLTPYAPALAAGGVNLARLLVVRPPDDAQWAPEWATEQALISGACDVVLAWVSHPLKPRIVRRLQLATQRGRTLAFLLRPWSPGVAREPSHALLRVGLEPRREGVKLSILKSRGGMTGQWWLPDDAAQAAAGA
ncbi:MAG TPA: translesion DNA synthesis-associated protein ImuA [Steroidobacteraceae bacterium]|nr:translesion DNA synthesis-associated protein ImuA [Steroidobacteraceae bacterium]